MKHKPADDRLIEILRAESISTYVQQLIARVDQERRHTKIAKAAVRHAVQRNHISPEGCSPCEHIDIILGGA
jgi:hypothetical protein